MSDSTEGPPAASLALPPGPDEYPIVGSTLALMRRPLSFLDDVSRFGDIVAYTVAGQRFTAVLDPAYVERVLLGEHDRFVRWSGEEWGDTFAGYASEGLLLSTGEQWRRQRGLIQAAFTPDRIEAYREIVAEETDKTLGSWSDGDRVDVREEMSTLTLRILARTLFDVEMEGRGKVVRRAASALNDRANARNLSTFLPSWVPTRINRRIHRSMDDMESLLDELITERRGEDASGEDLLSLLLTTETDAGDRLSEREVRDQLITFLFAGHETTALALTYTLHAVGTRPEVWSRLRSEASRGSASERSPGDGGERSYTERVIRESLRLYPPVYVLFRKATEDVALGGYRIPEGSKVTLPQIHIHRDGRFYENPERFRPNRWTPDFEANLPEYAYFPFGGGPRHCIGMRFAMMEMKRILPRVVGMADITPIGSQDLELETGVTLQPAQDVEARVELV